MEKDVLALESLFWPGNGMRSTYLLVKIHNKFPFTVTTPKCLKIKGIWWYYALSTVGIWITNIWIINFYLSASMSVFLYKYYDNIHKRIREYQYNGAFQIFWKYDKIRPDIFKYFKVHLSSVFWHILVYLRVENEWSKGKYAHTCLSGIQMVVW